MGNRAIVKQYGTNIGVYLHWNGGRDSVEAFLKYCEMQGFRGFDDDYGIARFCQVVGNFFGGGLSLGIIGGVYMNEDSSPGDNGIYEVKGWEIVGRYPRNVHEQNEHKLEDMLEYIDSCQPKPQRFGKSYFRAKVLPTSELRVGDKVFIKSCEWEKGGAAKKYEVAGIGVADKWVNGHKVEGVPYINRWPESGNDPAENPNNYLFDAEYRAIRARKKKSEEDAPLF